MDKMKVLKTVSGFITTTGVSCIIGDIIANNTKLSGKNILVKTCMIIGSCVLADMIGTMATEYVEKEIDIAADLVKDTIELTKDVSEMTNL